MKKENIIDLVVYRNQQDINKTETDSSISEELNKAIQNLIYRLRELGPIKQSG